MQRTLFRAVVLACGVAACCGALVPAVAGGFGTVNILGQHAEHERITRLALYCRPGQPHDGSCFENDSLSNVAGTTGQFGAVGAADNIPLHFGGGPSWWHCDDADYMNTPNYPQSRAQATAHLQDCRAWARGMLYNGHSSGAPNAPSWGAVKTAGANGSIVVYNTKVKKELVVTSDPGSDYLSSCSFNGAHGRAKCNVWESWGYVLHAAEDFYSHSNWSDHSDPKQPISLTNPPGLAHRSIADFWDLRQPSAPLPDEQLATGCYPNSACTGRITHDDGLNKDKEYIDTGTGLVSEIGTRRAAVDHNAQWAVTLAIDEARRQWAIFRDALVTEFGVDKGGKIICALTSDHSIRDCNNRAPSIYAAIPASFSTIGSELTAGLCIDDPGASTKDGTVVALFKCNGSAAQQFQFTGRDVQFKSSGESPAVKVVGKCLDAPSGTTGTRVQIQPCDGKPGQRVTVAANGVLQMRGSCLDAGRGESGSPIELVPCDATADSDVWQLR